MLTRASLLAIAIASTHAFASFADGPTWSEPTVISNPEVASIRPAVVADPEGVAHIFWIERGAIDDGQAPADYLVHLSTDGIRVSDPNEILVIAPGSDYLSATATNDGFLHLVWVENRRTVQHSRAWAPDAHDARSWSTQVAVAEPALIAALTSDDDGRLHLVYSPEHKVALSYMQSQDGGETWDAPQPIESETESPFVVNARVLVDQSGVIHLAWFNSDIGHWGLEVYYARSVDGGSTWENIRLVDTQAAGSYESNYGPAWVDIGISGRNTIHLIWDGSPIGQRWEQISTDGGITWSDTLPLFGELRGITGLNALVMDSAQDLHLITGRLGTPDQNNLMVASWTGNEWGEIEPIAGSPASSERPSAAVALGNRLFVAWESEPGSASPGIYLANALLDAPTVDAGILEAPASTSGEEVVKDPVSQIPDSVTEDAITSTSQSSARRGSEPRSGSDLTAGIIPALVIVLGAVAWKLRPHRGL